MKRIQLLLYLAAATALLVCGCEMRRPRIVEKPTAVTEPEKPTPVAIERRLMISDFNGTAEPGTFSDREEIASDTRFSVSFVPGIDSQALQAGFDIESYAGIAIPLDNITLNDYDTLILKLRPDTGEIPRLQAQFRDANGRRYKVQLNQFIQAPRSQWATVIVPLATLTAYADRPITGIDQFAMIWGPGEGHLTIDDVELQYRGDKSMALSKPPYPERTTYPLPNGLAAWAYHDPNYTIKRVKHYNQSAPAERRIRYLFPYGASITLKKDGSYVIGWNLDNAKAMAEALKDDGVMVMPMVDGHTHNLDMVSEETWDAIAKELMTVINNNPLFYGVHVDLEPHHDTLHYFYSRLKAHSPKPVTIACGEWNSDTFRYTDMAVLMAYDWASDLKDFRERSTKMIDRFLTDARAGNGRAMIGVPAIATHHEYEYYTDAPGGPQHPSGHHMIEYVRATLEITEKSLVPNDPTLIGYTIWAFHPNDGLHSPGDTRWYYPTTISRDVWKALMTP